MCRYAILMLCKAGMGGSGFDALFPSSTRMPNLLDHKHMNHMISIHPALEYGGSVGIWSTKLAGLVERWKGIRESEGFE